MFPAASTAAEQCAAVCWAHGKSLVLSSTASIAGKTWCTACLISIWAKKQFGRWAACIKTAMRCRMCTACLRAARIIRCICRAMLIPVRRGTTAASPNSIYFRSCGTISTITGGQSAWSIIAATRHFGSMPRSAAVRAGKTAAAPFGAAATALPTTKPRNGRRKASWPAALRYWDANTTCSPHTATTNGVPTPKLCSIGICGQTRPTLGTSFAHRAAGRTGATLT